MSFDVVRALILTSVAGGAPATEDVRARIDERVVLYAAVEVEKDRSCVWITEAPVVNAPCKIERPASKDFSKVVWNKVEADRGAYDNVPGGQFAVASIGWIESPWREGWTVDADVSPIVRTGITRFHARAAAAGTMRYRIEITHPDHGLVTSPALRTQPGGPGVRDDIRKVSLRMDDTALGFMSELGGVPYIFGSTELGREPHQAERALGVDCADLMIYGLRRGGSSVAYRSSRTLAPVSTFIARSEQSVAGTYIDGRGRDIVVGPHGLQPGDWVIFAGHVGAFFEDRGILGVFDQEDLLLHTVWREPAIEPMRVTGYGAVPFEIRRPNP